VIDFHCHLDLYPHPARIASEAQRRGVGVLSVTTTPSAWPGTRGLAEDNPVLRTALGFHPQLARERINELALFERYLHEADFVGEVGLDGTRAARSFWDEQVRVFEHVLSACSAAGGKVLTIHSRGAASAVLDQLKAHPALEAPILHWFSGTKRELIRAIQRGCWFSVGPAMLSGASGRERVLAIPRNRILLETDGPFGQVRGQPLFPWDAVAAISTLARIWAIDDAEAANQIRLNEHAILSTIGAV
jgi:TatD DNase family protein